MKRGLFIILSLLPILGVFGSSEKNLSSIDETVAERVVDENFDLLAVTEMQFVTKYRGSSRGSNRSAPPKSYFKFNWITWDSENRLFVSLFGGVGIFQHERIFKEIPDTHIFGLKFNPAVGVALGYRFNPIWTFRLKYMNTTAFYAQSKAKAPTGTVSMNAVSLNVGFDLIKIISPLNDGKNVLSPYLGVGALIPNEYVTSPITTNFGLAYVFNVNERFSLNLDAEMLMVYGVKNESKRYPVPFNFQGSIMAGVSYRF